MSTLKYKIPLEEEIYDEETGFTNEYIEKDIPHFKEISLWLSKEWNESHMEQYFDGILAGKIESCTMKCHKGKDGKAYAMVTIQGIPGFRFTAKYRDELWDQLDGQMTDGFGETYDRHMIPGVPEKYRLAL